MPPRKTTNSKRQMFKSIEDVKEVLDKVVKVESLKIKSVKTYVSHLRRFMRDMKINNVCQLLNDYEKTYEYVQNKIAKRSGKPITLETKRTYFVTLNSVAGHVDFVKAKAKSFFQDKQDEYNQLAHEERAKNKVLEKHKGDPPKWKDLKDLSAKFTNGTKYNANHLIVSLYTLIPPRRGEYRTLMYLDAKPDENGLQVRGRKAVNELRDAKGIPYNYVYPDSDGIFHMVLRAYKTKERE